MENLTNSFKKNSNDTDLYEYGLFVRLFMLWTKQKIQPNYIEEILKHSFNTIAACSFSGMWLVQFDCEFPRSMLSKVLKLGQLSQ